MDSKSLKVSWSIVLIVNCIVVVIGLIVMIAPEVFLIGEYEGYTGKVWADHISSNPDAASLLRLQVTQTGWYIFTIGVFATLITILFYKRGDKRSWYILLILTVMGWGGSLVYDLPAGDTPTIMMIVILFIIGLVGLAIGAKPILKGPSS
jgi:MFS family permease